MMETPEHIIAAYLDGDLSSEERERFEADLGTNPKLAETVEQQRQMKAMLASYYKDMPDREVIHRIYQEVKNEKKTKLRRLSPWQIGLLIAASMALLIWAFWPAAQQQAMTAEELFASHFVPSPAPERMGTDSDSMQAVLRQAHIAYAEQAYPQAIAYYQRVLADSSLRSEAAFYLAQGYLATRQYEQASRALKWVNNRKQEVSWFSALAALGQGDLPTVRQLLQPLATHPAYDYHLNAKELLDQLP